MLLLNGQQDTILVLIAKRNIDWIVFAEHNRSWLHAGMQHIFNVVDDGHRRCRMWEPMSSYASAVVIYLFFLFCILVVIDLRWVIIMVVAALRVVPVMLMQCRLTIIDRFSQYLLLTQYWLYFVACFPYQ